jgi:hypothetical protein
MKRQSYNQTHCTKVFPREMVWRGAASACACHNECTQAGVCVSLLVRLLVLVGFAITARCAAGFVHCAVRDGVPDHWGREWN